MGRANPNTRSNKIAPVFLSKTELLDVANDTAGGLRLLQRKRLELARAMATNPKLLLLDEIAGGLTDAECTALINTIKGLHSSGVTIIWIEHVLHALTSVVERLLVLDFGKVIGLGDPGRDHEQPGSQRNIPGDRSLMSLLETHALTAHYGDFQALFGVDIYLNEGETVAIIGANGAGKSTLMRSISGVLTNGPDEVRFDGQPIGSLARRRNYGRAEWPWCPRGAGCFLP